MRSILLVFLTVLLSVSLFSCGGGSTVTGVSVSPESTDVPLGGSTTITASSSASIVENVTGEKVRFSFRVNESGATLDVINDRLDGNSQAKVIYRAGTRPGNDVVQVSFDSGATATVQIRVGTGQPVAPLQVEQVGATTVRVTVKDTRGLPINGANVLLSINIGQLGSTSGTTNGDGIFETSFTLPSGVTSARVTATVQGVSASANVSTADTSVARIQLSQRGSTPGAGGAMQVQVQARAFDRSSRPVSQVLLNFSIQGAGTVTPVTGTTDANGVVLVTVTLPAGVNSTSLAAVSGTITQTLTVTRQTSQVGSIQLEQFGTRVRATVLDSAGNPINGAQLNFAISAGTVTATGTTDSNGIVEVTFSLPAGVNSARLTAISGNVEASLNVQRAQTQVATIRLEQFGSSIMATALDSSGTPLPGVQLNFRITAGTIGATGTTNDNGIAEVTFTLPEGVNTARVMASSGTVSATLDVVRPERSGGKASVLSATEETEAGALRLEVEGMSARVWVHDMQGKPLEGKKLDLAISVGTLGQAQGITNINGLFETTLSIPAGGESPLLTAECDGMSISIVVP